MAHRAASLQGKYRGYTLLAKHGFDGSLVLLPNVSRWYADTARGELDHFSITAAKQHQLPGWELLINGKIAARRDRRRRRDWGEPAITIEEKLIMTQLAFFVELCNGYPPKTGAEIFGLLYPFQRLRPMKMLVAENQSQNRDETDRNCYRDPGSLCRRPLVFGSEHLIRILRRCQLVVS